VAEQSDPRIAHVEVAGGPSDLVGHRLVRGEVVTLNGEPVWVPRVHPGVPELVAVAEAEQKAERLRHQLLATIVPSPGGLGQPKRQPNETLVVEMRSAAETTVISAVVGLEAFCSHHVTHCMDQATGTVTYRGEYLTAAAVRDRSLDERFKLISPSCWRNRSRAVRIGGRSSAECRGWPR
jgi:hypothetical protein